MIALQVEALQGYRVIDIACGSGDAQTLCLTDDDTVWSWGDGDYGKLGRGGSDGCKVPMKVFEHNFFIVLEAMRLIENTENRFVNICKLPATRDIRFLLLLIMGFVGYNDWSSSFVLTDKVVLCFSF